MAQMGRPRAFDRDAAVIQAMHLFWQNGYDSTSLNQLKAALGGGISAPSFYAAFGSKEALFREAAARYLDTHGRVTDSLFDSALAPRVAIETALRNSARMQCEADHPLGCMVSLGVTSTCTLDTREQSMPLKEARARTRDGIQACVERGIALGALRATTEARVLTTVFDSFLTGLSTLARDGVPHAVLDRAVTQVMQTWDAATADAEK